MTQEEIKELISELKVIQKSIIDECTRDGIRANIQIAAQIDGKCFYPYLDNTKEIKKLQQKE